MLVLHVVVCIAVCHMRCETLRACGPGDIFKVIYSFPDEGPVLASVVGTVG